MLFVSAAGHSPADTISAFFTGAFGGTEQLGGTLSRMVPLVLVALGWILVFKGGRFHVGFPGQIMIGGLLTAFVTVKIAGLPAVLHLPLGLLAGIVGGAAYAGLVAWLWASRGVNEILSSLLLNLIAVQIISWSVRGPLQEEAGILPQSDRLQDAAIWPSFPGFTLLSWDILLIPIALVAVAFVLYATSYGLRLRLVGNNPVAARYAGTSPVRVGVIAIVASGALAGIAGSALIQAGSTGALIEGFDGTYGFQGIAVALLARNSPLGVIPAALLFAALAQGGTFVEARVGVSSAVVGVTEGLVICFVAAAAGLFYSLQRRQEKSREDVSSVAGQPRRRETVTES